MNGPMCDLQKRPPIVARLRLWDRHLRLPNDWREVGAEAVKKCLSSVTSASHVVVWHFQVAISHRHTPEIKPVTLVTSQGHGTPKLETS